MTRAEQLVRRIKNNKLVSLAIAVGVIVISIASFTDAVVKLGTVFSIKKIIRPAESEVNSKVKLQANHYQQFKRSFDGVYGPRKINYGTGGEGEIFVTVDVERRVLFLRGRAYQRYFDDQEDCDMNIEVSDQINLDTIYKLDTDQSDRTAEAEYVFPVTYKVRVAGDKQGVDLGYSGTVMTTGRLTIDSKKDDALEHLTFITFSSPDIPVGPTDSDTFEVRLFLLDRKLGIAAPQKSDTKP